MAATTLATRAGSRSREVLDVVRRPLISPKYGPVLITALLLVAMFVLGGLRYTGFASTQVVLNLLVDNAYLIVLAVGMTFVILTGGIDLSVGAVVALSTMIAAAMPIVPSSGGAKDLVFAVPAPARRLTWNSSSTERSSEFSNQPVKR